LNGGLEQGVQAVIGGTVAWHAEIDPGACRVLAHRYPDVPNLGDVERVGLPFSDEEWEEIKSAQKFHGVEYEMPAPDWSGVDPVDVLTGGFPCTDVSAAGKREGIRPGTRSGLWGRFLDAIEQLHPSLVVIENVRGLLSADAHHPAHSELEPCPWDMGDGSGPTLRALGAVLGDLADIGFDAEWVGLRAADAGAPHGRFRVFIVAWPAAGAGRLGHGEPARAREDPRAVGALAWGEAVGTPPAHPDGDALREQPVPIAGGSGPALAGPASADAAPHPRATDGTNGGPNQRGSSGDLMLPSAVMLLPTPQAQNGEERNQTIWARDPSEPQNLENALAFVLLSKPREATDPLSGDGRRGQQLSIEED
jgi:DNA (cytosine-5)-methyltransferase 1